jgi:hypothetical protein
MSTATTMQVTRPGEPAVRFAARNHHDATARETDGPSLKGMRDEHGDED